MDGGAWPQRLKGLRAAKFITFNVNRANPSCADELGASLKHWFGASAVVGLQECQSWGTDVQCKGWEVSHAEGSYVALLWPTMMAGHVQTQFIGLRRACGIGMSGVAVLNAYLPDSSYGPGPLKESIDQLVSLRQHFAQLGYTKYVLMGDFNTEFPNDITDITGTAAHGKWHHDPSYLERQTSIIDFIRSIRCRITSSFRDSPTTRESCVTYKHLSLPNQGILDHVCLPAGWPARSFALNSRRVLLNQAARDHFPVCAMPMAPSAKVVVRPYGPCLTGWQPNGPVALAQFTQACEAKALRRSSAPSTAGSSPCQSFFQAVVDTALATNHTTKRDRLRDEIKKPEKVKELERRVLLLQAQGDRPALQRARKALRRSRAGWHRVRLRAEGGPPGARRAPARWTPALRSADGIRVHDRSRWPILLRDYCNQRFFREEESLEVQERRLASLRRRAEWEEAVGKSKRLVITPDRMLRGRARLTSGSAASLDLLANEMIKALPILAVYEAMALFQSRLDGSDSAPVEAWVNFLLVFLQKRAGSDCLDDYRGIALLSAGLKWYANVLLDFTVEFEAPCSYRLTNIFGFVEGMACQQITAPLMLILAKSYEWPKDEPVHFFAGDVKAAFDNIKTRHTALAMERRGLPARLIHALLLESRGSRMHANFQGVPMQGTVFYNASERTGSTDAPAKWNWILDDSLAILASEWFERGMGIRVSGRWFTHAVWADNVYLLASTSSQLEKMVAELSHALNIKELYWKKDSLVYMSPVPNASESIRVPFKPSAHEALVELAVHRTTATEQLGVLLNERGCSVAAFEHRLQKAQTAWYADPLLCNARLLPRAARMQRYQEAIAPVLAYGSEGWSLSPEICRRTQGFEGTCLRRLYHPRKYHGEHLGKFLARSTRQARRFFVHDLGHTSILERIVGGQHALAGAIKGSLGEEDPWAGSTPRLWLSHCLRHRPEAEWRQERERHLRRRLDLHTALKLPWRETLELEPSWTHRAGWRRRATWEDRLIDVYGLDWRSQAAATGWAASKPFFVAKVLEQVGASRICVEAAKRKLAGGAPPLARARPSKRVRFEPSEPERQWRLFADVSAAPLALLDCFGDSQVVVGWLNGKALVKSQRFKGMVAAAANLLGQGYIAGSLEPAELGADWVRHVPRELNTLADAAVNAAMDAGKSLFESWPAPTHLARPWRLRVSWDGGRRNVACAAAGFVLQAFSVATGWQKVLCEARFIPGATSMSAELQAACMATSATMKLLATTPELWCAVHAD